MKKHDELIELVDELNSMLNKSDDLSDGEILTKSRRIDALIVDFQKEKLSESYRSRSESYAK